MEHAQYCEMFSGHKTVSGRPVASCRTCPVTTEPSTPVRLNSGGTVWPNSLYLLQLVLRVLGQGLKG